MKLKDKFFKITLTIPTDLDKELSALGHEAREKGGHKLAKTLILRALVRMLKKLEVDVTGVKTEDEFYERLLEAVKRNRSR